CRLAELKADMALAPLAQAQAKVTAAQARLDQAVDHRRKLGPAMEDTALAALAAQQIQHLWRGQAGCLRALAAKTAELEAHKDTARKAVGRHNVLKALVDAKRGSGG
ncbi:MAG: hypothetical protein KJP02_00650, partial [Octadecabacter sp.]|nr:hypothetical protein [Octadecabacter sp.]